jgi:outer membrane protein assembly factor BamB
MKMEPSTLRRTLSQVAVISAFFSLLICMLTIITYLQVKRADPLNNPVLVRLNTQLIHDPANVQLQEQIRELDLMARKAFFTSQWQIRAGGYLLALFVLILIIATKWIDLITPKIPEMPGSAPVTFWFRKKKQRVWILAAGGVIIIVTLVVAWLTDRMLEVRVNPESENQAILKSDTVNPQTGSVVTAQVDSVKQADSSAMVNQTKEGFPTDQELRANVANFRGYGGYGIAFGKNYPASWDGSSRKNIRWKTEIPLPGFNSPVIWNGKVFISGAKEKKKEVYCIDAVSGKILWTTDLSKIPGSPDQVPKVIAETGQAAPTMTTDGRRVYVIFANGDLAALDMTGSIVWSKNLGLPKNHYGHSSSLIMYRDMLIIQYDQSGSARVMALDGRSGEKRWETSRNVKVSWASPVLIQNGTRPELILAAEPAVIAYDPATGAERWKVECISGEVGPSVAFANGRVFSVNDYSKLAAIKLGENPSQLWENDEFLSDVPSPVATGDLVFVVTSYGAVVCYDAETGEKLWTRELEKPVYSSPMIADGKLWVMDKTGIMYIFKADKTLEELGRAPLGEGSFCTPAFCGGRIYIRGNKNLYCIE